MLRNGDDQTALKIINENILSAEIYKDHKYAIQFNTLLVQYYRNINENHKAEKHLEKAKYLTQKNTDLETLGYYYYIEGWFHTKNNHQNKAIQSYLNAIRNYESANTSKSLYPRLSIVYKEITALYALMQELDLQKKYSQKALEYANKQNDPAILFNAYMSFGFLYEQQIETDDKYSKEARNISEQYYLKAYEVYQRNKDSNLFDYSDLGYLNINLANFYINFEPKDFGKAEKFALQALDAAKKSEINLHLSSAYGLLAEIALEKDNFHQAKSYLLNALDEIKKNQDSDQNISLTLYQRLSDISVMEGDFKNALNFYKIYVEKYKSAFDQEKLEIAKRLEAQFNKERQEQRIFTLGLETEKKEQQLKLMRALGIQQNQEIRLMKSLSIQKEQEFKNLQLVEENQRRKLEFSELESEKRAQALKLSRLETQNKSREIINFKRELDFKEKINKYYSIIIISSILLLITLIYILFQRSKSMKQKEKLYALEIEQEKQNSKISTLTALLQGQEQERERMARDLHDGLGGLLSGTKMQLSFLYDSIETENKSEIKKSQDQIDGAVNELRRIAHNLMPDLLLKYGLEDALKDFATRVSNPKTEVHVQFLSYKNQIDQERQLIIYRILQELVNNAIKHANASEIIVQIVEEENQYHFTVEDDGIGFDTDKVNLQNSAGLHNLNSRIEFLKGQLKINSDKNLGTSIEFYIPK